MNYLIAKSAGECAAWPGTAVIIDVLRTATTVCALLAKGERNVVVCPDAKTAQTLKSAYPNFSVMTEFELPFSHEDNSPFLAEKLSSRKAVLLADNDTGRALQYLRRASVVLLGGFCNFRSLVQQTKTIGGDVLLVPATLFNGQANEEDMLCAQAFKEFTENISMPGKFIEAFKATVRLVEFSERGPRTAMKDLELALNLNCFSVVPQAAYPAKGNWAVCVPVGKKPDPAWATFKEIACVTSQPQEQQFQTMVDLNLRPMVEKTLLASQLMPQPRNQWMPSLEEASKPPQQKVKEVQDLLNKKSDKSPENAQEKTPKNKLKGFFSGLVQSIKEETKELEKSFSTQKPPKEQKQEPEQVDEKPVSQPKQRPVPEMPPAGPTITRSVLQPEKVHPSEKKEHKETDGSEVPLSDGTTTWEIKKPRPSLEEANAKDSIFANPPADTPKPKHSEEVEESTVSITDDPQPARPQERVLELSVLKQGGVVEAKPVVMHQPSAEKRKKAIVLFSGGLDSTTCLHWAIARGYECEALTVSYGQRHSREVAAAQAIARKLHIKHHLIDLHLPWLSSSALVDENKVLPNVEVDQIAKQGIPSTYVPGRNLMFLSIAGSLLDAVGADAIVAGPNAVDFSGYPDCTPAFFKAAGEALNRGTQRGVREGIDVLAPLMHLSKAEIVRLAVKLHVPLELTWSCYAGGDKPCGKCDSCKLRAKGFAQAGMKDPAL